MDNIPAVANNKSLVNNAEFVKLTIYNEYGNTANSNVYTFSSSYKEETIDGQAYSPLGGLLAVGVQQRDIRVTSADTTIALSGVSGNNIYVVLDNKIRGSKLEITRGFYDNNYNLTSNAHRFTGIVTNYQITEERQDQDDNYTVSLMASSFKSILENRIAGRKTNSESWKEYNPTDTSMDRVPSLADRAFSFGQEPKQGATTQSQAKTDAGQVSQDTNTFVDRY
tara:strand:+ start:102 stop:773 length:672 start_codon:yes stop_codon:yes gene_type:complete